MTFREFHVWGAIVAAALLAPLALSLPARGEPPSLDGLRLVMVEAPYCQFCLRWHREVGGNYADRAEGKAAPLVRYMRDAEALAALGFKPAVYTPTFILVRGREEIGRIPGYPGERFFWEELGALLRTAGASPAASSTESGGATKSTPDPVP